MRDLTGGDFLDQQRNIVRIGGTGAGKSHLAVAIARACIRSGRRGRFFNAVDLVNKLDTEVRADRQPTLRVSGRRGAPGLRRVASVARHQLNHIRDRRAFLDGVRNTYTTRALRAVGFSAA